MKKTDVEKIKKELENGFGKRCMRNGIEYGWYNAAALDAGIQTRATNARKWREKIVQLSEVGEVTEEKLSVRLKYTRLRPFKVTAYYVAGELKLYRKGGKFISTDPEDYEVIS
jgi:hypothetical protein